MDKSDRYTLSKHHLLVQWGILGLALLIIGLLIGYSLVKEHYSTGARERDRLSTQVRVINHTIEQHLEAVSRGLQLVREELPEWRSLGWREVNHRLRALDDAMPGIRTIYITDARGTVLAADRESLLGVNYSYRDYFDTPRRGHDPKTLYLSPPFRTVPSGVFVMNVTLTVPGPHGEFNGIITASLDPFYFNNILSSVLYAPDMRSAIVHGDGLQFLTIPELKDPSGINRAVPGSFFTRHLKSGKTGNVLTGISASTGQNVMMALSTVNPAGVAIDKPLIVTVSRTIDSLYSEWRRDVKVQGALFGLMGISGVLGLFFYQRRQEAFYRLEAESIIALRDSELRYRRIVDTANEGIWMLDEDTKTSFVNNRMADMLGYRAEEMIGKPVTAFMFEEDAADHHNRMENRRREQSDHHERRFRHKNGQTVWTMASAVPISDAGHNFEGAVAMFTDITERKKLEEQLQQSQKLEAIGTLAGGIAHDFNNLLQGLFGYISIAKLNATNKDKSIAALEQAEKALHMSVNLTGQLLTFSKGGKPVKKNIPLQSIIENSVKFALSGSNADYRIKLDSDLWHVEADEGQIGQVIQNIVLNADQAMPMGGAIVITAGNLPALRKRIPHLPEEGKYVEISVKDNGTGISAEHLSKIFDPYFTTKAQGSGLGLATCYAIIKNHGGVIHVASKPGKGTTLYIYLPAVEQEREAVQTAEHSPFVRKGRVLLMDDEELVREIAGKMMEVFGHEVAFAEHGEAAIGKYKAAIESGNPFDIVILDLTIRGGMGGKETIERLLAVDPGIKAIVSSGYSDDAVMSDYQKYGFSACLTKPYKLQELGDTLNNLLADE